LDSERAPRLVWCFLDIDRHIHQHGYDDHVITVLGIIEEFALELVERHAIVIAHSDHGLVRTTHIQEISDLFTDIERTYACRMGGAGRTRWIYAPALSTDKICSALRSRLPSTVDVESSERLFRPDSLALQGVGNIVVMARGDAFVTFDGQSFEHGSNTNDELDVPLAMWSI
jgi:hypothetical protein